MTSFVFSVEQLRAAPPEVRRWIEREIAQSLAALERPEHEPAPMHEAELAACRPEEAVQIFEMIKDNFLCSQVFFELARDMPGGRAVPPLHAFGIADILRHARLADANRLVECFTAINQAYQTVRDDPQASLFGFDEQGHVYIHETTHRSIRLVWERLVAAAAPAGQRPAAGDGPGAAGFSPPHLGPSENVGAHPPGRTG